MAGDTIGLLTPLPGPPKGHNYISSLPYEGHRVEPVCGHSRIYVVKLYVEQPAFCGLCMLTEGFQAELPSKFHMYKTLAENGNPETAPKFLAHLVLAMGLKPPAEGEDLQEWRSHRKSLAREQYTRRSNAKVGRKPLLVYDRTEKFSSPSKLFPVASALWKLVGYQPPLGKVLVPAIGGTSEQEIADRFGLSLYNVHIRIAKGIRTAVGFLPN